MSFSVWARTGKLQMAGQRGPEHAGRGRAPLLVHHEYSSLEGLKVPVITFLSETQGLKL